MKDSIAKRIKITKKGKTRRRATTLGHSRANKRKAQLLRKKRQRDLSISKKRIARLAY